MKNLAPLIAIIVCVAFFLLSTLQEKEAEEQRRLKASTKSLDQETTSNESILAGSGYHNGITPNFSNDAHLGVNSESDKPYSIPINDPSKKSAFDKMSSAPQEEMEGNGDEKKTPEENENKLAEYKPGAYLPSGYLLKMLEEVEKSRELSQMIEKEDKKETPEEKKDGEENNMDGISLVIDGAVDTPVLSAFTGGCVSFLLNAGLNNRNREYLVLGSLSGTYPGSALPNKDLRLPLNWDFFTETVIASVEAGSPFFFSFHGFMDEKGCADAKFCTVGALPTEFANQKISFAYLLIDKVDFVSNPVSIILTQ